MPDSTEHEPAVFVLETFGIGKLPDAPGPDGWTAYDRLLDMESAKYTIDDFDELTSLETFTIDELTRLVPDPAPAGQAPARSSIDPGATLTAAVPSTFALTELGCTFYDHDGKVRGAFSPAELDAVWRFVPARTVAQALAESDANADEMTDLVARLVDARLLTVVMPEPAEVAVARTSVQRERASVVSTIERAALERNTETDGEPTRSRPPVVPVFAEPDLAAPTAMLIPPTALGMIMAHAMEYEGGRLQELYDFTPLWIIRQRRLRRLLERRGPGVFLFSNYVWNTKDHMALSAMVKELSPESITIHGGPNTPSYPADAEAFLRAHPHVDIVARNEGEVTVSELLSAFDGQIDGRDGSLSVIADVPGVAYLDRGAFVRTSDRDRVKDLDSLPSPFLNGLFDTYGTTADLVILESNRGCPYGCTFCDWGSATLSRIRKFDLERVFAELEWAAKHDVTFVNMADANFGIFERDIAIAEKVAELRQQYGNPRGFSASRAKNTVKHLRKIISVLKDADVYTDYILALQTTDEHTLEIVRRKNIKAKTYEDLAIEYRRNGMQITTDLIVGLPGSTQDTLTKDLQISIDREIYVRAHAVELLVNSPMNAPEYLAEYEIEAEVTAADPYRRLVVSTSSYTRAEHHAMWALARFFNIAENLGLLRYVARWVRQETGVPEMELYRTLIATVNSDDRYPLLRWLYRHYAIYAMPPLSWQLVHDELCRFLEDEMGIADSSARRTALTVQHALAPDRGRSFPIETPLEHDYAAWYAEVLRAKSLDVAAWQDVVPPLASFGPASLPVDDPGDACGTLIGRGIDAYDHVRWELASPVGLQAAELGAPI